MLSGWQHCWLAISAHPSLAALQPGPMHPWLAAVVAVVPWNLVLSAAAAAGAVLWLTRGKLQAEKAALRYPRGCYHSACRGLRILTLYAATHSWLAWGTQTYQMLLQKHQHADITSPLQVRLIRAVVAVAAFAGYPTSSSMRQQCPPCRPSTRQTCRT